MHGTVTLLVTADQRNYWTGQSSGLSGLAGKIEGGG